MRAIGSRPAFVDINHLHLTHHFKNNFIEFFFIFYFHQRNVRLESQIRFFTGPIYFILQAFV